MMSTELLDSPIAFHRAFVRLGAGITGALMLSQAMYWSKRTKDENGWFYKTQSEWEDETGLSRSEQEGARRKLKKLGVLQEERKGVPCKTYYRIDTQALDALLCQSAEKPQSSMRKSCKLERGKPANKDAENPQPSLQESRKQDCGNPDRKAAEKPQTITETTQRLPIDHDSKTLCASGCATESSKPDPEPESKSPTYRTAKGRTLSGEALENFEAFWNAFDYRKDKARAADAWLKVPWARRGEPDAQEHNRDLLVEILTAAQVEAGLRPAKLDAGQTPCYAERWLSARRWEDETPDLAARRQLVRQHMAQPTPPNDRRTQRDRVRDAMRNIHDTTW